MRNAWADLPNAALIDEVLACAAWTAARDAVRDAARDAARAAARDAARAAAWTAARAAAWTAARDAVRDAARDAARAAARDAARGAAWDAAWGAAWDAAWGAAWDAVAALVAWTAAAELYPLTPAQLRLSMQLLPAGDHRRHAAVLLLPYAVARELINTQEQTT